MKLKERSAIDLLVLPGWAIPNSYYLPLLSSIKSRVRKTLFDYGFFPQAPGKAPMLMPALGKEPAPLIIMAHSLGSLFAFRLAAANPAVKGLILFGGFARFSAGGKLPGRSAEDIDAMRKHLFTKPELLLKSFYRASAAPNPLRIPPPESLNLQGLSDGLELLASDDVSESVGSLKIPMIDFVPDGDMIVDSPMSGALASLLPSMQIRPCKGEGHLFPLTKPEEAGKAVDEFLAANFPKGL